VVGDVVGRCAIGGPLRAISIIASTASSSALSKRTGIAIDTLSRPVLKNDLLDNFGAVDYANSTKLEASGICLKTPSTLAAEGRDVTLVGLSSREASETSEVIGVAASGQRRGASA